MSRSNVHRLLQNRVYTGDFDWNGRTYRGSHEPLISTALFERVQGIFEGRYSTKEKVTKHEFTFSGLVHCGHCGCAFVGEMQGGVRLLGRFSHQTAKFKRKAEIAEFRVFELHLEGSNSRRNLARTL